MTNAKILQLTNPEIGTVAVNGNIPLGTTTVVYPFDVNNCCPTYSITSSMSDTLVINKPGTYRVVYNVSAIGGGAGDVEVSIKINGTVKYIVGGTLSAAGTVNLTVPYEIYVPCNCASAPSNVPATIQFQNTGIALTGGTSNLIISKEY